MSNSARRKIVEQYAEIESLRQQLHDAEESNKAVERALKDVDYRGSYADGVMYLKGQLASLAQGVKIQVPSNTMEQEFSHYHRFGYNKAKKECEQQLAAALAACEEKNRGLDKLARLGNEPYLGNSVGNRIAAEFLAIKPDASILKQHDAELIERCADKLAICLAKDEPWEPAIRELKAEL